MVYETRPLPIAWHRMKVGESIELPIRDRAIAVAQASAWARNRSRASLAVSRPRFASDADGDVCRIVRIA